MARPKVIQKGQRSNEIIKFICENSEFDRKDTINMIDDAFWSVFWSSSGPKFRAYYDNCKKSGKNHIIELIKCISDFSGEKGWASRRALSKELTKGAPGTKPSMHPYELTRKLQDLTKYGVIESKGDKPSRTYYRFSWKQRKQMLEPEHERVVRRYVELSISKDLAHEYGARLGLSIDDVDKEIEKRLDMELHRREGVTWWPFDGRGSLEEDLADYNYFFVDSEGNVTIE